MKLVVAACILAVANGIPFSPQLDSQFVNFKDHFEKEYVAVAYGIPFSPQLDSQWMNFKSHFEKEYALQEEFARRLIWEQNVAKIVHHNLEYDLGMHSYRLGINKYADLTQQEFVSVMNGYKKGSRTTQRALLPPSIEELPDSVDWRKKGLVTPVKDQGQCGSCWAFSATGSLEGQHKKATGNLVSLSEQNLVDCSGPEGNDGCEGGLMDDAFDYVKKNKGIDTEASYPYEAVDDTCKFNRSSVGATLKGYVDVASGDEYALQKAVATVGPVSVAIDASSPKFQFYSGGIYDDPDCSTTFLDHGVLAVGYGTEDGQDFWLVKNSWGVSWGLRGYIKMSRNKGNQCGIATNASYPLV